MWYGLFKKIINPKFYLKHKRRSFRYCLEYIRYHRENRRLADKFMLEPGPLVSIIIPLYNQERYITKCFASISMQNYRNWECIIVDDCSTDKSQDIAEKLTAADARFRIVRHKENKRMSAARNSGIEAARGELLTFLDADDFLLNNSLLRRVSEWLKHRNDSCVVGVYCDIVVLADDTIGKISQIEDFELDASGEIKDFLHCGENCPFMVHSPILSTEIVRKFGGFNESFLMGVEDWEFWQRILRHGYILISSRQNGAVYRQHRNSISRKNVGAFAGYMDIIFDEMYSELPDNSIISGTPFVYRESLAKYQFDLIRARKFMLYGVKSLLSGDKESFLEVMDKLPEGLKHYFEHHCNLEQFIVGGAVSIYCLPVHKLHNKIKDFDIIKRELTCVVRSTLK